MRIYQFEGDRRKYMPLLLLADEQESMVEKYIGRGEMYLLEEKGEVCGQCIVTDEGDGIAEIKSLSVHEKHQRKGYARSLIEFAAKQYADGHSVLQVGTGDSPLTVPFYERCGFVRSHIVKNFFIDYYDHPIIEDGVQLKDMVYLRRRL